MSDNESNLLNIAERRELARRFRVLELLMEGMTDNEVCREMKIGWDEYDRLRRGAIADKVGHVSSMSTEEVYVEYIIQQKSLMNELAKIASKADRARQYSALSSSIKMRSDIYDKIIKLGQEFGIIAKKPERKEIAIAGVVVNRMENDELRGTITQELVGLDKLIAAYGDKNIIDLPNMEIHRSLPAPIEMSKGIKSGTKGHGVRGKVHGGRKVVKR